MEDPQDVPNVTPQTNQPTSDHQMESGDVGSRMEEGNQYMIILHVHLLFFT